MTTRNVQRRVAPWFQSSEPVVGYVDEFTVKAMKESREVVKGPTAPGHWWSADDGWTGPFQTHEAALQDGRSFLAQYRRR